MAERPSASRELILGSGSPRRLELLAALGLAPRVVVADIDERVAAVETPPDYVKRMAREKCAAVVARTGGAESGKLVLAADTVVVANDEILGKPADRAAALAMLGRLSGQTHCVLTAVALGDGSHSALAVSTTRVSMRTISPVEASQYWASGEPADKAGGYGIQGLGGVFVSHIDGSYTGVMGLPVYETAELLAAAGVELLGRPTG
ncbi:MAG: Maf family protein [Pseudomonadota bacterium]